MISHPLVIAVLLSNLLGLVLLLVAAWFSVPIALHFDIGSASSKQLKLERALERNQLMVLLGLGCFVVSPFLFVVVVVHILPGVVPGAMCGLGVAQAMAGKSAKVWVSFAAAMTVLLAWYTVYRADVHSTLGIFAKLEARLLLLSAALAGVAFISLLQAFAGLNLDATVDCCSAVYQSVVKLGGGTHGSSWKIIPAATMVVGISIGLVAASLIRGKRSDHRWRYSVGAVLSVVFGFLATKTIIVVVAPYFFGVLVHQCPYCLFLKEHYFVGYPLFLLVGIIAMAGPITWFTESVVAKHKELEGFSSRKVRQYAYVQLASLCIFLLLTSLPAIVWRLQHGVWISG